MVFVAFGSFVALITLTATRTDPAEVPNDELPPGLEPRLEAIGPIPWFPHNARTHRHELRCIESNCVRGASAYVVALPDQNSTLHLSTQAMLRTGYPSKYPVATVLVLGPSSKVEFIMDIQNSQRLGLRPTIVQDNSLRNMGLTWATQESHPTDGRNVTGNKVHSFVVSNESRLTVRWCIRALNEHTRVIQDFVRLEPGTMTLFWPSGDFYGNPDRSWRSRDISKLAALQGPNRYDHAASIAESLMYEILA